MTTLRELAEQYKDDYSNPAFATDCRLLTITLAELQSLANDDDYAIQPAVHWILTAVKDSLLSLLSKHLNMPPHHALLVDIDYKKVCQALLGSHLTNPNASRKVLMRHLLPTAAKVPYLSEQLLAWYPNTSIPIGIIEAVAETFKDHLNEFGRDPALQAMLFDCLICGISDNDGLAIAAKQNCAITIARINDYQRDKLNVTFNKCHCLTLLPREVQQALCLRAIEVFDDAGLLKGKLARLLPQTIVDAIDCLIKIKAAFALPEAYIDKTVNTLLPSLNPTDIVKILESALLTPYSTQRVELLAHFNVAAFLKDMPLTTYQSSYQPQQGFTHTDKDHLEQDFEKNISALPKAYLQKILDYLKSPSRRTDESTFVRQIDLPVTGNCTTARMQKVIDKLTRRIETFQPPVASTSTTSKATSPTLPAPEASLPKDTAICRLLKRLSEEDTLCHNK